MRQIAGGGRYDASRQHDDGQDGGREVDKQGRFWERLPINTRTTDANASGHGGLSYYRCGYF